ncbi:MULTISPECIES: THxN family PEP-CTERM protein [unclassified Ruegeria]|uniref:THxN family PEP-CTERM protein n=1 Tax=unclassified Ruegeria TaxID=2625375 RepID=UPI001487AF86|nr:MULTISPECIES: THxN family PEP-CTERM protein [unclassified Ruegeria]NOD34003.1 VPLPA-CTERM sorting domain-containing protein [Ruegeria sp. HKCCD7296]NOD46404.1 VPLPA-CTERM sorting domain-containing protein [Ruegeria sp. HKCCD5849]NOD50296.1 VPLPA-CTERM sorting domain-containing protein [Ruegeria sp. HKCCD5851]NOD67131.1 VPLPA-CTERM sorting domain-containing protein [Ruegeria sp. HKCCD7303]NOE32720.1 VPLPA-CTERM sorting domain-containing protein [Ruegeria sp. HKCCD7318]
MALKRNVAAVALVGVLAGSAASALSVTAISPSWQNVNPTTGITESSSGSTISLRWGGGSNPSGYDFTPTGTPILNLSPDTAFDLGQFTHLNFPIPGDVLSSVDLVVDLQIGGGPLVSSTFSLTHNETLNRSANCPQDPTPCNDVVTIANTLGSQNFTFGGQNYVFSVLGFSQDGGNTISTGFSTVEEAQNYATLYGQYTIAPVPLPAAGWLLLGGIGGLFAYGRRQKRKAA